MEKRVLKNKLELIKVIYNNHGLEKAVDTMTAYLLKYGDELLAVTPAEMLFIARPAVARANRIIEADLEDKREAEEAPAEEPVVEVAEIDAEVVIAGLTAGKGLGALRAMIGANNFVKGKDYLQFSFKGCKKANNLVIRYDAGLDLFNMEFIKIGTKDYIPYCNTVKEVNGLFTEELKTIFENFTGLYITL